MAVCVKVFNWKVLHPVKHFFTQFFQRTLCDHCQQTAVSKGCDQGNGIEDCQDCRHPEDFSCNCLPVSALIALLDHCNNILHKYCRDRTDNSIK